MNLKEISQRQETPVTFVAQSQFSHRFSYARALESQQYNDPGQDYLTFLQDGSRFVFVLCDGVSQSFIGDLAARVLGKQLISRLRSGRYSSEAAFRVALTKHLGRLTQSASVEVANYPLPSDLPDFQRVVLDEKRAHGSETTFVVGYLDLATDVALFGWMGDSRLRLWRKDGREMVLPAESFKTFERWSTRKGIDGELHVIEHRLSDLGRIQTYSDGIFTLDEFDELVSTAVIMKETDVLGDDDISFLEIWPHQTPKLPGAGVIPKRASPIVVPPEEVVKLQPEPDLEPVFVGGSRQAPKRDPKRVPKPSPKRPESSKPSSPPIIQQSWQLPIAVITFLAALVILVSGLYIFSDEESGKFAFLGGETVTPKSILTEIPSVTLIPTAIPTFTPTLTETPAPTEMPISTATITPTLAPTNTLVPTDTLAPTPTEEASELAGSTEDSGEADSESASEIVADGSGTNEEDYTNEDDEIENEETPSEESDEDDVENSTNDEDIDDVDDEAESSVDESSGASESTSPSVVNECVGEAPRYVEASANPFRLRLPPPANNQQQPPLYQCKITEGVLAFEIIDRGAFERNLEFLEWAINNNLERSCANRLTCEITFDTIAGSEPVTVTIRGKLQNEEERHPIRLEFNVEPRE